MRRRFLGAESILPLAILAAAIMLGISEFMVTFQFTPPGGEALRDQLASDRHNYSLLLLAVFTVLSMLVALATGLRVAAIVTAILGGLALLLFLLLDLPDAGKLGDLEDPVFGLANARAEPQLGFWLEAVGAVVLGLATGAFATLSSEQLRAPTGSSGSRGGRDRSAAERDGADTAGPSAETVTASQEPVDPEAEERPRPTGSRRGRLRRLSGSDR